jgi:D-alanine-D-alanine ligase
MSRFSKIRVAVLRGGPSEGYGTSLKTGEYVLSHLREMPDKYEPIDIFISKDNEWHIGGLVREPRQALLHADLVWNALHCSYGEDGKVQQILDALRIPYTGSNAVSSALAMNKEMAKSVYKRYGFSTPQHEMITDESYNEAELVRIFREYLHPVVVKPANRSLGLSVKMAYTYPELKQFVEESLKYSSKIMIEEMVRGTSASCVVLDRARGERAYAFLPVEIMSDSSHRSPGNFSAAERKSMSEMSKLVHHTLGMRHYSSSDFIITPKGKIYILETNSLPALHKDSLVHASFEPVGWKSHDFIDHVVELALNKR